MSSGRLSASALVPPMENRAWHLEALYVSNYNKNNSNIVPRAAYTAMYMCYRPIAIGDSQARMYSRIPASAPASSLSLSLPFLLRKFHFSSSCRNAADIKSRLHRGIFTGGSIQRPARFHSIRCRVTGAELASVAGIRSALLNATKSGVTSRARKLQSPRRRSDASRFPRHPAKSAANHAEYPTTVDETSSRPPPFLSRVTGRTDVERTWRDLAFAEQQIGRA